MKKLPLILSAVVMLQFPMITEAFAKDRLLAGEQLNAGSMLTSEDGRFALVMQTDGNLVLYKSGVSLWSTNTDGDKFEYYDSFLGRYYQRYPQKLKLQTWGALEVRDSMESAPAFWKADTAGWMSRHYGSMGQPVPTGVVGDRLLVQNDGNVVLSDNRNGTSKAVWASNTYGH